MSTDRFGFLFHSDRNNSGPDRELNSCTMMFKANIQAPQLPAPHVINAISLWKKMQSNFSTFRLQFS